MKNRLVDFYRRSFGRVVAVVYTGGTVAQVLRLLVGHSFNFNDMPFWVDWALVVLGSYGGIGLLVFARQVDYRGVWEKVVHGLIAAHLLVSVVVHLWAIVVHSHAMFAVFPYGYSFFATAYFAAFAWRSWTMRLKDAEQIPGAAPTSI